MPPTKTLGNACTVSQVSPPPLPHPVPWDHRQQSSPSRDPFFPAANACLWDNSARARSVKCTARLCHMKPSGCASSRQGGGRHGATVGIDGWGCTPSGREPGLTLAHTQIHAHTHVQLVALVPLLLLFLIIFLRLRHSNRQAARSRGWAVPGL